MYYFVPWKIWSNRFIDQYGRGLRTLLPRDDVIPISLYRSAIPSRIGHRHSGPHFASMGTSYTRYDRIVPETAEYCCAAYRYITLLRANYNAGHRKIVKYRYGIITRGKQFVLGISYQPMLAKTGTSGKDSLSRRHIQGRQPRCLYMRALVTEQQDTQWLLSLQLYNNVYNMKHKILSLLLVVFIQKIFNNLFRRQSPRQIRYTGRL